MSVLALLYHDIVGRAGRRTSGFQGADADIYKLDPDEFRRHLQVIRNLQFLSLNESGDARTDCFEHLYITLDDGGAGAMSAAALLESFGLRGHFFIVTDQIGKEGFLSELEIVALHRRGHHIGSHSCSHLTRMSFASQSQLVHEWGSSVRHLSNILKFEVTVASVPAGFYSDAVAREASHAGIRTLFTSEPVVSARMVDQCSVIGRFCIQEGVSNEWLESLVSGHAWPRWKKYLWWQLKKPLKSLGGNAWLRARRKILAAQAGRTDS